VYHVHSCNGANLFSSSLLNNLTSCRIIGLETLYNNIMFHCLEFSLGPMACITLAMNKGNPRSSHSKNVFLDFPSSFISWHILDHVAWICYLIKFLLECMMCFPLQIYWNTYIDHRKNFEVNLVFSTFLDITTYVAMP
jgi:hypothetical protein